MNDASRDGRQTQIIATLGPSSQSIQMIEALADAGMDVARVNFSHASHAEVRRYVDCIRGLRASRPAVLGDLPGPKLRIGDLNGPMRLEVGQPLVLVRAGADPPHTVQAPDALFASGLKRDTRIYLQDGFIELEVTGHDASRIETTVLAGGMLSGRAGVALPDVDLELPAVTEDDRRDIRFAVGLEIEGLALSFVGSADDVEDAREMLSQLGAPGVRLVAKIERRAALDNLAAIADASDALMVARGDLGVAIGVEEVPIWQHRIIAAGQQRGIPVIVATEMLESMRTRRRPTRAEASDIAHAVWDGASGVMLSAETAIGDYPVESVATMDRIARRAEVEMR